MRIIDAAAFERDMRNELRKHSEEKDSLAYRLYEAFLDEVKSRPTIEQPQWISVEERLPQEDEPLENLCKIVQVLLKDGTVTVGFCNRSLKIWAHIPVNDMYFTGKDYAETPVVAWKPLSQPPKGDE